MVDKKDEPSEFFITALRNSYSICGSSEITCSCGKHHFAYLAEDNVDDSDRTWEYYCNSVKEEDPDNTVIDYESSFIESVNIDGKTIVLSCECRLPKRYENFIWSHRHLIREYLKIRVEQEYQWAEEEKTLNRVANIDNDKYNTIYDRYG